MSQLLQSRKRLDRRRLEDAFILFAVLEMHFKCDLELKTIEYDRNKIVQDICDTFRKKFISRWTGM